LGSATSPRTNSTTPFSTGRTITNKQANFSGTVKGVYLGETVAVGSFAPNAFGLGMVPVVVVVLVVALLVRIFG
jgi:hypothetical protein